MLAPDSPTFASTFRMRQNDPYRSAPRAQALITTIDSDLLDELDMNQVLTTATPHLQTTPFNCLPHLSPATPIDQRAFFPMGMFQPPLYCNQTIAAVKEREFNGTAPLWRVSSPIALSPYRQTPLTGSVVPPPHLMFGNVPLPPEDTPTTPALVHRVAQRMKQVEKGKASDSYKIYCAALRKSDRQFDNDLHPITPRPEHSCSKRRFDHHLSWWKRQLHLWDKKGAVSPEWSLVRGKFTLKELNLHDDILEPPLHSHMNIIVTERKNIASQFVRTEVRKFSSPLSLPKGDSISEPFLSHGRHLNFDEVPKSHAQPFPGQENEKLL